MMRQAATAFCFQGHFYGEFGRGCWPLPSCGGPLPCWRTLGGLLAFVAATRAAVDGPDQPLDWIWGGQVEESTQNIGFSFR